MSLESDLKQIQNDIKELKERQHVTGSLYAMILITMMAYFLIHAIAKVIFIMMASQEN